MIVRDFQCKECNEVTEEIVYPETNDIKCACGGVAEKIFSVSNTSPYDAGWIKSVLEVVDKSPDKPHCQEFLKHPNRSNYKNWMTKEGLRCLDPGEEPPQRESIESKKARVKPLLMERLKERESLSI